LVRFYNWSSYYALAVIELGEAIKANRALTVSQSSAR
jgi:membrane-bound lytic murein transglycosylase B